MSQHYFLKSLIVTALQKKTEFPISHVNENHFPLFSLDGQKVWQCL